MTEIIKDDVAPGPIKRKTERAVTDKGNVPVLLLYDEDNDRTVMARGDISGGMKVIGMLYDSSTENGEYLTPGGATQGGLTKAFMNTDTLEDKVENIIEQLKILNLNIAHMTGLYLDREDIDKE